LHDFGSFKSKNRRLCRRRIRTRTRRTRRTRKIRRRRRRRRRKSGKRTRRKAVPQNSHGYHAHYDTFIFLASPYEGVASPLSRCLILQTAMLLVYLGLLIRAEF